MQFQAVLLDIWQCCPVPGIPGWKQKVNQISAEWLHSYRMHGLRRCALRADGNNDGDARQGAQSACQAEGGRFLVLLSHKHLPVGLQLEYQVADVPVQHPRCA